MALTLILGNQLFSDWTAPSGANPSPLQLRSGDPVLMVEDLGIASHFRYHKLRLLHTFVAMREFRDRLKKAKIGVKYFEIEDSKKSGFFERIERELDDDSDRGRGRDPGGRRILRVAEIPDLGFRKALEAFCKKQKILLEILPSPHFLCSEEHFAQYLGKSKRPFMKTFYERERKRLGILVTRSGEPEGGRWSFDEENRKKLPKGYREPALPKPAESNHEAPVRDLIEKHFAKNPGRCGSLWLPSTRDDSLLWLQDFIESRLTDFGPYEDAISQRFDTVNHSTLAPLINLGLLNPAEVVDAVLKEARKRKIPLASVEGFIRQVIGWREFVRGIDSQFHERQHSGNFFGNTRKLSPAWYEGTTGIPPLDDAIRRVNERAYLHHIERLMIVSNLMLLSEIHPQEAYRWFMEMHLDSYEWVMGPNVFGMGQMSDGGIFATKPYISGSNYILKMSDYEKGPWCQVWDGLYWSFIERHRDFFGKNPRLSMMVKLLDKMDAGKKKTLFRAAKEFVGRVTLE
ncbi:deoxyribodipyrimidine photolyase [bacterium]|nr:deoxyribodipyrimidine photolyase [bacterium]